MCELFAMSSKRPTHVNYSLSEFAKHGGLTHHNMSGWGIAYFDDDDVFLVKEASPAHDSALAKFIAEEGRTSNCVIAHVRLATVGDPVLKNTHPFRRAMGGRMHVFAHNGDLKDLHKDYGTDGLHYKPIGETDSELAFCLLLERLRPLWEGDDSESPSIDERLSVFAGFCTEVRKRGSANFLYSDGEVILAHAHRRMYEENGGFSKPRAPGLSMKSCFECDPDGNYRCDGLNVEQLHQMTTVLASVPLDAEGWEPLPEGTAIALSHGIEVGRAAT